MHILKGGKGVREGRCHCSDTVGRAQLRASTLRPECNRREG